MDTSKEVVEIYKKYGINPVIMEMLVRERRSEELIHCPAMNASVPRTAAMSLHASCFEQRCGKCGQALLNEICPREVSQNQCIKVPEAAFAERISRIVNWEMNKIIK